MTSNVAVWFEIPARNLDRATGFYETILATHLKRETIGETAMAVFPYERPGVSGAVVAMPAAEAAAGGTIVYLNCDGKLAEVIGRVEAAGGKVLTPRVDLPGEMGSFFHIRDSEGNRIGLHAAR